MFMSRSGPGDPLGPLLFLLSRRVRVVQRRFVRLLALYRAGKLPQPRRRAGPPAASEAPPDTPRRGPEQGHPLPAGRPRRESLAPRGVGWLTALFPWHPGVIRHAVSCGHALRNLLDDPEMAALLQAAPQLVRYLRPLCRMLGVLDIPALPPPPPRGRPPRRGHPSRPRRPPPPELDPSVPRDLTDGQVRWLIAHGRKVPRDWKYCPATDGRIPSAKPPPGLLDVPADREKI